jgi:hypothetical protein
MLPSERLLDLAAEPFSYDWLRTLDSTLEALTATSPPSPESRVAIFVARRVCMELAGFLDAIAPVDAVRHDAIAAGTKTCIVTVVSALARFKRCSWADLAALIAASREVRVHS